MELFNRNPFVRKDAEVTELETVTTFAPVEAVDSEESERNWTMLAALAVAALAFTILVVMTGTWLYHKTHSSSVPSNTTQSLPKAPPQNLEP